MNHAKFVFLLLWSSANLAGADVVGTLNIHTTLDGRTTTGRDSGQAVVVQVDFSRTQDGVYDISVWSGTRQLDKTTRVQVQQGKAAEPGASYQPGPIRVHCPATNLEESEPTSFQIFVQAELDSSQKGGRVLIAEAEWAVGSVKDGQPGRKIEPREVICSAGSNLDSHATGSFWLQNQSNRSLTAALMFGGRKYGDYKLSSHGNQKIQADAWGVNPGVGWYVTIPNPSSPNGQEIEAAGPIYNTEGGSDAGFNTLKLIGPNSSPTPAAGQSAPSAVAP
jgi:hypothetical protein